MKKIFIALLFFFSYIVSYSQVDYNQQVHFNYSKISIEDFILKIEQKFKINFSYGNIDLSKKVEFVYKGTLKKALEKYFSKVSLKFKIDNNHIILKIAPLKNLRSNVLGKIEDESSKSAVINATIVILNYEPFTGVISDIDGYFSLKDIPIGRYDLEIKSIGYETKVVGQIMLNSAKDVFLDISLTPSVSKIEEVVITSAIKKHEAINEMAMSSSRSFSIEETKRYAMSLSDPARMAQNYAGVSHNNDDSSNDIVIRGNSPRGLLWRIEGIEIPNPNHFGDMGGKGGNISLLNSSTLTNSDFYTSSFPAQFGNSLSGIFDLKLRKGNSNKREHSFKIGLLGLEASTEGFFTKKSRASYLFNIRMSTLYFFNEIYKGFNVSSLNFQDLSFKVHIPTKNIGTFSIFGIGGLNSTINYVDTNANYLVTRRERTAYLDNQYLGVIGVSNKKVFSEKTQLKTNLAISTNSQKWEVDLYDSIPDNGKKRIVQTDFKNLNYVFSATLNHRFSSQYTFQTGIISTQKNYNYFLKLNIEDRDVTYFSHHGNTQFLQHFSQWKYRIDSKLTLDLGYHFSWLLLNKSFSIDPRLGLNYKLNKKHSVGMYVGVHTKPEHISTYLVESNLSGVTTKPNFNLKMTSALHTVFSYKFLFAKNFSFNTELYYQYLYNVPVRNDENSFYSTINSANVFDVLNPNNVLGKDLINKGNGHNFGIDLTLEKYFSNKYFAMFTASLFDSYFTTYSGKLFRTKFANNYLFNLLGGKEFVVGKNKNNRINLSAKLVFNGGQRYSPIDETESKKLGKQVLVKDAYFTKQFKPYIRLDLGFNYVINMTKNTHTFTFDIQNVLSRENDKEKVYDTEYQIIRNDKQLGLILFMSYKLDFAFIKKKKKIKTNKF